MKKQAVYYQARLRIVLDLFGFVPYAAESIEAYALFSKEASLDTTLKSRGCCFGGFFFFLLVLT